jgi:hypothetical protein
MDPPRRRIANTAAAARLRRHHRGSYALASIILRTPTTPERTNPTAPVEHNRSAARLATVGSHAGKHSGFVLGIAVRELKRCYGRIEFVMRFPLVEEDP